MEARRRRMTISALVREALERRLGICEGEFRELPFEYIVEGDDPHLSENMDRILAEEWPDAIMGDR